MKIAGLIARGPPPIRKSLLWLRGFIIVSSIIILAVAAYALSLNQARGPSGFIIFVVILSWPIYGSALWIEHKAPHLYYRPVFLVAYILGFIFWLSGWAWNASWAAYVNAYDEYYGFQYNFTNNFSRALAACAGLGVFAWLCSLIVLIEFLQAAVRYPEDSLVPADANDIELGRTRPPPKSAYRTFAHSQPQPPLPANFPPNLRL
ncbi:hypothetical protein F4778DRAFT_744606 [Xylariomycetidae sp. FL2044]|nr:hypothetical protein F4778DRAFT_744606 [Xylariomycetidae sp. FL2044]